MGDTWHEETLTREGAWALAKYIQSVHGWSPKPEVATPIRDRFVQEGGGFAEKLMSKVDNPLTAIEFMCELVMSHFEKRPAMLKETK